MGIRYLLACAHASTLFFCDSELYIEKLFFLFEDAYGR